MVVTYQSKVKDIYINPVGHDIIKKLLMQMGKEDNFVLNPLIGNLKLKTVARLTKKKLGSSFYDTFLNMLNMSEQEPLSKDAEVQPAWWKEAVFYQIYPRSFMDSNGDGIGDLNGIREKLDYLKELGVTCLWLSPIYDSPNDDNGYDIRDYQRIMKEFGTMEDFDQLLSEAHDKGIRLILDLVVNHTSDEHPWFQKALEDENSKEHDFYILRKGTKDQAPNNWTSFFSGSAWNYYEKSGEWGLHLFSKKQMDLNWDNPELRHEIAELVKWWLAKGVDGFRMDVINYISKQPGLPDGDETVGNMMGYMGVEHYFYGPKLHEYLHELKINAFEPYQAFNVGETPGIGMEMGKLLTGDERKEMDMIFNFDQLETPGHVRFDDYTYDLNYYKNYIMDWIKNYGPHCWLSLFYENHDNPRMISKVNTDPKFRIQIGKLLAMMQLTLKGTPFIFQGQELGLVNQMFSSMDQLRDIESINLYEELIQTMPKPHAFQKILAGTRDHARVPMPWNNDKNAGFTTGTPWITRDEDYKLFNAKVERKDKNSVFQFYKSLLELRKTTTAFTYGDILFSNEKEKDIFTYHRFGDQKSDVFYIECNLCEHYKKRPKLPVNAKVLLSNYAEQDIKSLRPYEANLYRIE